MTDRQWTYVGLAAIVAVVIYNLSSPTSVTTSDSTNELDDLLVDPGDSGYTPGGAVGTDLYGAGPYTSKSIVDGSGLFS